MPTPATIYKTRIAPTPTGYLHLGNAYNFALTAAMAHKHNASILLRIDDMDYQRVNSAYVQDIFDTLELLDIPWHEGPRSVQDVQQQWGQQHRLQLYNDALHTLQQYGLVYACSCSRSEVQRNNNGVYTGTSLHSNLPFEGNAWRLNTTGANEVMIKTRNGFVHHPLLAEMQHFIVRKKDGNPAYQLTSVADDVYFNVNIVIRGADLWPSTIAQHYLAQQLQQPAFGNITFYHHKLLTNSGGEKLSKSAGSTSIQYLRKQGYTAKDIYAMLGRLAGIGEIGRWEDIDVDGVKFNIWV